MVHLGTAETNLAVSSQVDHAIPPLALQITMSDI